jgi:hypothetical protein
MRFRRPRKARMAVEAEFGEDEGREVGCWSLA